MNFLGRLKYYLIGVGIGLLMVMAIFKDRKLGTWTPKNQINQSIAKTPIHYSEKLNCYLNCLSMDTIQLKDLMINGKVDFDKSDVRNQKDRNYFIKPVNAKIQHIKVNIKPNIMEIEDVELTGLECDCQQF